MNKVQFCGGPLQAQQLGSGSFEVTWVPRYG